MTDYATHYRRVMADPTGDTPRAVLADYLADQDDPAARDLAAFIRLQLDPATAAGDAAGVLLSRRVEEWLRPVVPIPAWIDRRGCDVVLSEGWRSRTTYRYRRGFPGRVELPTALFFGGPCPDCRGRACPHCAEGEYHTFCEGVTTCSACDRTGAFPPAAAALFAHHPLTEVRLTDRTPLRDGWGNYSWVRATLPAALTGEPEYVPEAVFEVAPPGGGVTAALSYPHPDGRRVCSEVRFVHEDHALAWLSARLVLLGRTAAGLPPTPP